MAHIIRVNGAKIPYTGTTLKDLQTVVGGPIESVYCKGKHLGLVAVINQEAGAERRYNATVADMTDMDVRGDAVVFTREEYDAPRQRPTAPAEVAPSGGVS